LPDVHLKTVGGASMIDSIAVIDAQDATVAVWHVSVGRDAAGLSRMCGAWVLHDEPEKVELLTRGRHVVATASGAKALQSAKATTAGMIDLTATINTVVAERDRLDGIYQELPAARRKTLTPPRWPHVPEAANFADPPRAANFDDPVAVALGIARVLEELATAWSGIESQRTARAYMTDATRGRPSDSRNLPLETSAQ
jgi:hypothetical protein